MPQKYQKLMFDKNGVPFFRFSNKDGLTDKSLEQCGFSKTVETKAIIRREIYSEKDFLKKVGYFLVDLVYKIPSDERKYKYSWFYFDPKCMTNIILRNFSPFMVDGFGNYLQIAYGINLSNKTFLAQKSKPVRIKESEARALLQNHEVIGLFKEGQEGLEELAF
jgi:hypothetical protein